MRRVHLLVILSALVTVVSSENAEGQNGFVLERKMARLQREVRVLTEKVKVLEARIVALESLNAFPTPEKLRVGMIQTNKDAIINDINNLAANAYQYRIRPATMGGGGGSYTGFTIPRRMTSNDNADYESVVTSDSTIIFSGISKLRLGIVKALVNKEGRLGSFEYTGEFQ